MHHKASRSRTQKPQAASKPVRRTAPHASQARSVHTTRRTIKTQTKTANKVQKVGLVSINASSVSQPITVSQARNIMTAARTNANKKNILAVAQRLFSSYPSHEVLTMPALSPTMESGSIVAWAKKIGDKVSAGDSMAEVGTDKATVSFDSTEDGYIAQILVPAGTENIAVGTPVAILVDDDSLVAAFKDYKTSSGPTIKAAVHAAEAAAPKAAEPVKVAETKAAPAPAAAPVQEVTAPVSQGGRVKASPLARVTAEKKGVDVAHIKGSGPYGSVIKADVDEYTPAKATTACDAKKQVNTDATVSAPVASSSSPLRQPTTTSTQQSDDYVDEALTPMRRVIAKRLLESKQNIPHYYLTMEVEMDAVNALRAQFNTQLAQDAPKDSKPTKLSVNDFIIKASAAALRKVPAVNASWQGDFIRRYNYADISVAVATDAGLITPIVADADIKGLATISNDMKSLASRARSGKLQPSEYQGGTFTISNLGMFGIEHFSAIINPPQSAILAIGATKPKVVPNPAYKPDNGQSEFKVVNVMSVTASYDHRVVDGAVGAEWLGAFKDYLENPTKLLL